MFDELRDIEVRTEITREKSDTERILDIETELIEEFGKNKEFHPTSGNFKLYSWVTSSAKPKLKDITLSEKLLQEYINSRENNVIDTEAVIRGLYSAALLELTHRQNKEKSIFIDGKNKTFHYLFYQVHFAKRVAIQNFFGNNILKSAGRDFGYIEKMNIQNIRGDDLLFDAGRENGNLKHITINTIQGNNCLGCAGFNAGTIEYVVCTNIKGNDLLSSSGKGHSTIERYIALSNVHGKNTLRNIGDYLNDPPIGGKIEWVLYNNITGERPYNVVFIEGEYKKIANECNIDSEQKKIISDIIDLAKSFETKSAEEQTKIHDEIAALQIKLFSEET